MNTPDKTLISSFLDDPTIIKRRQWRILKDRLVRYGMTVGGLAVIAAVLVIFFYLLYVVFPLLISADIEKLNTFEVPASEAGNTVHLTIDEKNEIGARFTDKTKVIFFNLKGKVVSDIAFPIPNGVQMTSFAVGDPASNVVAYGLSDGSALVVQYVYNVTYPNGVRTVIPTVTYPVGETPIKVDGQGQALVLLDVQLGKEANTVAAVTQDNRLVLAGVTKEENFLTGETTFETTAGILSLEQSKITHLLLEKEQKLLYMTDDENQVWSVDIKNNSLPKVDYKVQVLESHIQLTAIEFLIGDISLLIGDSTGRITQWFPVRGANNVQVLTKIREFYLQDAPITAITPEQRRKGFAAVDSKGQLGIYHSTAHRTLLTQAISDVGLTQVVLAPRADFLLAIDNNNILYAWKVHNEHPEVSWSALWGKVWYESQEKPEYIWQSSAANSDAEPKFSLMPLVFGTIKAAFYAMIVAIPLAIFGAMYTAYFMSPAMRGLVKPTIEIMAALPTVVLGFLAGLWLAPFIEANLLGIFLLLLIVPLGILTFAYCWRYLSKSISYYVSEGWQALILVPTIIFTTWIAFVLGTPLENLLFNGNMPQWLENEMGIGFDQRNALIVGIVMGLAVIPSIFSITEDAIFSVPKHLTMGSLALGATPWQTMVRVVLLTASPGIFSAIMIGMGRAVGETMIVLMATGNTPIMDFNIFEGLRTLSANIAVEMPESEVNSTHYRILFLSGLVLFMFTFFLNTLAEVVRQRLRRKYSSL